MDGLLDMTSFLR